MTGIPHLRIATLEDASAMSAILQKFWDVSQHQDMPPILPAGDREQGVVIELDRQILGWGQLKRYSPRGGYRYCGETKVYIQPQFLRRGYGTQIKRALIEAAREFEYHHLLARVEARNEAAVAYNLKLGYEVVGVQKDICFIEGKWEDVVVLQYLIR